MSESNVPVPPAEKRTTKYSTYPKPEAEYQEIIQNPDIFLQKLQAFHVFYGTKFRIPTIGGSRLDLHQLFLEVTSRGGIEKVIRDRRWKEVTAAFKFPTSITSASFVLRKYYLSLLYHFEQVYYFRKEEPSISQAGQTLPHAVNGGAAADQLPASPNLEDGSLITGTIDGKFDYGYLVTVNLGSEELKGVLYHTSSDLDVSQSFSASGDPAQRTRRKHQIALRDPAHPKRNRSGYTFFFAEQYQRLRPLYHGQERAISKKIGQLWSRLTEAEKQVYQEKGVRDKERYKAEMLEYKSSQHPQP
ncbi:UNVERIFIED_CONTAM: High mobility group B protein 10 [Sesamum radiatum]|uniref:High mobility group B protein 10 n=1 Tax=Sesamum radiatum TaxID=300843 RepID=A0AAW2KHE7_SESRA